MVILPGSQGHGGRRAFSLAAGLRIGSFLALFAAIEAGLVMGGWQALPAMGVAMLITLALGAGALYSPLVSGLMATRDEAGRLAARSGRGASWTGGVVAASMVMALIAVGLAMFLEPRQAAAPLATFALGLNLAYLPAKAACFVQGCCRPDPLSSLAWLTRLRGDLRLAELVITAATLALAAALAGLGPAALAATGFLGHGLTRLLSITGRGHALQPGRLVADPGAELPVMAGLALLSLAFA